MHLSTLDYMSKMIMAIIYYYYLKQSKRVNRLRERLVDC